MCDQVLLHSVGEPTEWLLLLDSEACDEVVLQSGRDLAFHQGRHFRLFGRLEPLASPLDRLVVVHTVHQGRVLAETAVAVLIAVLALILKKCPSGWGQAIYIYV